MDMETFGEDFFKKGGKSIRRQFNNYGEKRYHNNNYGGGYNAERGGYNNERGGYNTERGAGYNPERGGGYNAERGSGYNNERGGYYHSG